MEVLDENFRYIKNYSKATVSDLETDGLLNTISKIHIVGYKMHNSEDIKYFWGDTQEDRIRAMLEWHINNEIPIVFHNGICFDKKALEIVLGIDLSELMIIDTLWLSYYLNIDKARHSVEALSKDYNVSEKYQLNEGSWENLSKEDAINRVISDVDIGNAIWQDFKQRLEEMYSLAKEQIDSGNVGGKRVSPDEKIWLDNLKDTSVEFQVGRVLGYIMSMAEVVSIQESVGWYVDQDFLNKHLQELQEKLNASRKTLEGIMPPKANYVKRTPPAKPFKKNGELSVTGQRWENLKVKLESGRTDEYGNPLAKVVEDGAIHELRDLEPPNINSHTQVKDFLFSKGWKPQTFKYNRDEEAFNAWIAKKPVEGSRRNVWNSWMASKPEDRAIPQIKDDDNLCASISELAKKVPEISVLEEYSVIAHRIGVLNGIKDSLREDGRVEASAHGLANTLRLQHRKPIVNLPSSDKLFAEGIRGSLSAEEGRKLLGSDLSALENRVQIHLMMPHDPEYANRMSQDTFCPHIEQAVSMGTITREEGDAYKSKTLSEGAHNRVHTLREDAKPVVYSSAYGGTYKALMRQTGWGEQRCKDAIKAYWETNWSLKAVADEQVVITTSRGDQWLIHPIVGILLNLRSDKDKFNLVCQGGGSFFHFNWLFGILNKQQEKWGTKSVTANMHDEIIIACRDNPQFVKDITHMIKESVKEVSETYMLRRELDCDVQVGQRYSEIH